MYQKLLPAFDSGRSSVRCEAMFLHRPRVVIYHRATARGRQQKNFSLIRIYAEIKNSRVTHATPLTSYCRRNLSGGSILGLNANVGCNFSQCAKQHTSSIPVYLAAALAPVANLYDVLRWSDDLFTLGFWKLRTVARARANVPRDLRCILGDVLSTPAYPVCVSLFVISFLAENRTKYF
jgi:hypothetical protein